jgi:hypothetical protein
VAVVVLCAGWVVLMGLLVARRRSGGGERWLWRRPAVCRLRRPVRARLVRPGEPLVPDDAGLRSLIGNVSHIRR